MKNESKFPVIYEYVKNNPMKTATQIAIATGINELTCHRHLSGGRGKLSNGMFIREKVNAKRIDAGNRIRGTYHYLYSINPEAKQPPKRINQRKVTQRDAITAAWFGELK